jgi:hypothetical protein
MLPGPEGSTDGAGMSQPISPAKLDVYFIEASLTDDLPASAPVMIPAGKQQTIASLKPATGVMGLVALLGGCWKVHDSREEKKNPPPGNTRLRQ